MTDPAKATATTSTRGTTFVYRVPKLNDSGEKQRFTVVVSNCLTKMIEVTPIYEKTEADMIAQQVVIEFSGIAHGFGETTPPALKNYITGTSSFGFSQFGLLDNLEQAELGRDSGGVITGTHLGSLEKVLSALAQPRGTLQYSVGRTIIYNVAPRSDALGHDEHDDSDGDPGWTGLSIDQTPKLEVAVTQVISDTSAHVNIKATFAYQPCNMNWMRDVQKQNDRKNVRSLRWWYADDIDGATWGTRRMIRGRLEIYDRNAINVLELRKLVLPPIEWGFRREHIAIREDQDGMAMDFEVIDVEAYAHPPYPASNWDGQTRVTFAPELVGPVDVSAQIMLEGPIPGTKVTPKKGPHLFPTKEHLIHLLIRMLDAKLHWHRQITGGNIFTKQLNISESMKKNSVEASLSLQVVVSDENIGWQGQPRGVDSFRKLVRAIFANDMSYNENRKLGYYALGSMPLSNGTWGAASATQTMGHTGGIVGYDRRTASWWQPHDGTLRGILRCALQYPCDLNDANGGRQKTLNELGKDDRSFPEISQNENQEVNRYLQDPHGTDQGAKIQKEFRAYDVTPLTDPGTSLDPISDSVYKSQSGDAILSKISPSNKNPYFKYDLATKYKIDNGLTSFPCKGPSVGGPIGFTNNQGKLATNVSHYTRGGTAEVTIELNASRVDAWPVTPTDQSWIDEATGIMYMCKNLEVAATSVEIDATGNHRMFNSGARVTYVLSRAPRWFEEIRIASAPFIVNAPTNDTIAQQQIENYIGSGQLGRRKSGARYKPTNNTNGENP